MLNLLFSMMEKVEKTLGKAVKMGAMLLELPFR